jgi:2'-5' RNA ligase
MRLFLAIDLPPEAKKSVARQLADLRREYPYFRWVDPENYHLTLHFFGDVKPEKINQWMSDLVYDMPTFYLYSSELDLFIKDNLTLYIGFYRNKELEGLVKKIKEKSALGTSRRFVSHLTFGRYRIPSKQQYLLIKKKLKKSSLDVEFSRRHNSL